MTDETDCLAKQLRTPFIQFLPKADEVIWRNQYFAAHFSKLPPS
jgi:hypothetical protein